MRALLAALLFLAGPVFAQVLPAAYRVVDVAADDVLNIRAEPSAEAPVIGSFPPGRTDVEVLEITPDGAWGRVGTPEGNGWVSMRYLAAQEMAADTIPRPFRCVGTEPFWGLSFDDAGAAFSSPEGDQPLVPMTEAAAPDGFLAHLAGADGGFWTLIADRDQCSDGMSDRTFGWKVLIFRLAAPESRLLSGCCTLDGG